MFSKYVLGFLHLLLVEAVFTVNATSRHRAKRQLPTECARYTDVNYPCKKTIMETYSAYCLNAFYIPQPCLRQRPREIQSTCTRREKVCCLGHRMLAGRCVPNSRPEACDGTPLIISGSSGVLTSVNHPRNYPNNLDCAWNINAAPGGRISIRITQLNLQPKRLICNFGTCSNQCDDKLELRDGLKHWILCGFQSSTLTFNPVSSYVNITFFSDYFSNYPGFRLEYTIFPPPPPPSTTPTIVTPQTTTTFPFVTSSAASQGMTSLSTSSWIANVTEGSRDVMEVTSSLSPLSNRSANIICFGDQVYTSCQPYCNKRCVVGIVVSFNCLARPCRPTCACPRNRSVSSGSQCISEDECEDQRPPQCNGGKEYSDCVECPRACPGYEASMPACTADPINCQKGCTCPDYAPYLFSDTCIPPFLCPPAPVQPFCSGGRVYTNCIGCPRTCPGLGLPSPGNCVPDPNNCVAGCACPNHLPFWHNNSCLLACPKPKPVKISCGTQYYLPKTRIVGGEWANAGSWPWIIQIIKGILGKEKYQCGGTLICSNWILTAAHCFHSDNGYSLEKTSYLYRINIGKHLKDGEPTRYFVSQVAERIITHPDYDLDTHVHDVALIKLRVKVNMTKHIRPACVPDYVNPDLRGFAPWGPPIGANCYVAGWGSTKGVGPDNSRLKQAKLPIRSGSYCKNIYPNFDARTMICVGGVSRKDTCQGDSGGPIVCKHGTKWYVDGVTSYGLKCGGIGFPGVYTRVTSYTNWIRQQTIKYSDCAVGYQWNQH